MIDHTNKNYILYNFTPGNEPTSISANGGYNKKNNYR